MEDKKEFKKNSFLENEKAESSKVNTYWEMIGLTSGNT